MAPINLIVSIDKINPPFIDLNITYNTERLIEKINIKIMFTSNCKTKKWINLTKNNIKKLQI